MPVKIQDTYALNERELATVLAALRSYQESGAGAQEDRFRDIASDLGRFRPLSVREIDRLCERLNCG
jgi:hypothetical protein